ncbi:nucleoside 2-deoxyribosyltransferase [Jeotgalibaca ciconiae]|uniref:Nucleoside 2-deoxyribosyltransferase n=1 Tax=Jeotgalibaca ciconiae TaxID=2496265 RepID=A0A3Q9BJM9_9LACT|nr:nucleoside 2-deoxyribosyltransferase [Jeotgalibaca ciconiae]AZP03415.1 nucleoside 2-deoxyribosyltransferase [Jeotgalibaca ciconiae]HJB24115.1 nucleoside 2-deoxyribosyltransferase [Candidatus Jeotgalibaca pullicola]
MTKKAYYAAPLFSEMELQYNRYLTDIIKKAFPALDIYIPQEQDDINDKNAYADSIMIAKYDTDALLASDIMIAVLDGATIDVGVATEIGVAYQAGIPVIGLYTDSRQQGATNEKKLAALQNIAESQFSYANLYTIGLIKTNGVVVSDKENLLKSIHTYLD